MGKSKLRMQGKDEILEEADIKEEKLQTDSRESMDFPVANFTSVVPVKESHDYFQVHLLAAWKTSNETQFLASWISHCSVPGWRSVLH